MLCDYLPGRKSNHSKKKNRSRIRLTTIECVRLEMGALMSIWVTSKAILQTSCMKRNQPNTIAIAIDGSNENESVDRFRKFVFDLLNLF